MIGKSSTSRRRKRKVKRLPGRPKERWRGRCDHVEFFDAVRGWFTERELTVFKTSDERLRTLTKNCLEPEEYERGNTERVVKKVVNAVRDSVISVEYIRGCLGMNRNQYNQFIRYVKMDSADRESILRAKGYALAFYYNERYDMVEYKLVKKPEVKDRGLTFSQFKDLIRIAIWDREALLDKFQKGRKRPKRLTADK